MSRRRRCGVAGYSLIELLVVVSLLGVVGVVAMTGVIQVNRATSLVTKRTTTSAGLQKAIERIAREIRVADPLEAGTVTNQSLQVRVYRNDGCSRIGYYIAGGSLMQETQTGLTPTPAPLGQKSTDVSCSSSLTATPPTTGPGVTTTLLVAGLDVSAPIFTSYGPDGLALTAPVTSSSVTRIDIKLTTQAPVQSVQTSVMLRNSK